MQEATVIGCQQGGHSESNAILTSLLSLPLDQLQFSQPLISQSLQPLLDMTANGHASTLRVLCLSVQFVSSQCRSSHIYSMPCRCLACSIILAVLLGTHHHSMSGSMMLQSPQCPGPRSMPSSQLVHDKLNYMFTRVRKDSRCELDAVAHAGAVI